MWKTYLWQNFLIDKKYILFIVERLVRIKEEFNLNYIFEIWPGKWAITKYLIDKFDKILLFEKDKTLEQDLNKIINISYHSEITIFRGDFLWMKISKIFNDKKINEIIAFWNLPYYITSPIFKKIIENNKYIPTWLFMIQKEVAEKIKTNSKKKSYLRWLINYFYEVKYLKTVPPKAFKPTPKVYSSIIQITKRNEFPKIKFDDLIKILDILSPFKRKTIWKSLKLAWFKTDNINISNEILKKRLEDLSFQELEDVFNKTIGKKNL